MTASRRPWAAALAVAVTVTAIVWGHLWVHAPQPYGIYGEEYVEHAERTTLALVIQEGAWSDLGELVGLADTDYPPGIYAVGVALGFVFGHAAERITWTWMGWVALLGGAMAWIAGSLGVGRPGRAAAFAAAFVVPALPAAASRYHFDLPMTALCWLALAVAMGTWDSPSWRRRLGGGALVGVVAYDAVMMKWTAVPFLVFMLGGALLRSDPAGGSWTAAVRRRALGLVGAAAVALPLVALFLSMSSESLDTMSLTFTAGAESGGSRLAALPAAALRALGRLPEQVGFLPGALTFYGLAAVFQVLSPLVAAAVLLLGGVWVVRDRRGLWVVLITTLGGLAFLTLAVPVPDARFLLPLAPVAGIVGVLGWTALGPRMRVGAAAVVALVGVGVAADFHLARWSNTTPYAVYTVNLGGLGGTVSMRGLGLASSTNDRGWVRRDEALPHRHGLRQAVWEASMACEATVHAVTPGLLSYGADRYWWRYKWNTERLRGVSELPSFQVMDACEAGTPEGAQIDTLLVAAAGPEARGLPECLDHVRGGWRWTGFVADPDGGPGVAVYVRAGAPGCLGGPGPEDAEEAPGEP